MIGMDDVENHKPAPEGLLKILASQLRLPDVLRRRHGGRRALRQGRAACRFIGIAAPSNPLYLDLVFLFQAEGAFAIVDDINYLEEVLPA